MSVMDAEIRQALMKKLDGAWLDANEEDLRLGTRLEALEIAQRLFDELGEQCQAELMHRYDISRSAIDDLASDLRDARNKRDSWLLGIALLVIMVLVVGYYSFGSMK